MALRKRAQSDESLLRLIGLDWTLPSFTTLSIAGISLLGNVANHFT